MGRKHSRFGPSGSTRWITCPGSVQRQKTNSPGSVYAAEGSMLHHVSEFCLLNPDADPSKWLDEEMTFDGFKFKFNAEHERAVRFYIDAVWALKDDYPDAKLYVEEEVSLASYGKDYASIFGTADCILDQRFGTLLVIDLKGGKGVSVSADSSQPKLYGLMAAGKLLMTYEKIVTIIIQPRDRQGAYYKVAEHEPADLLEWWENTVKPAIDDGRSANPSFCASEDACRWCDASGDCETQAAAALGIVSRSGEFDFCDIDTDETLETKEVGSLEPEVLAYIMDNSKFISDFLGAVQLSILNKLQKGEDVPNYKVVEGRKNRIWDPDQDIEAVLKNQVRFKVAEMYDKKVKSPPNILKITPASKRDIVEGLIVKPPGKPTVAKLSDRRPSLMPTNTAEGDFEDIPEEPEAAGNLFE